MCQLCNGKLVATETGWFCVDCGAVEWIYGGKTDDSVLCET